MDNTGLIWQQLATESDLNSKGVFKGYIEPRNDSSFFLYSTDKLFN